MGDIIINLNLGLLANRFPRGKVGFLIDADGYKYTSQILIKVGFDILRLDIFCYYVQPVFVFLWNSDCCPKVLFLELQTSDLHQPGFDQEFLLWISYNLRL